MEKQNIWLRPVAAWLLAAAVAIGGCTRGQERQDSAPATLPNLPEVRFKPADNSNYVDVYPGTTDSESDRKSNGSYPAGRLRFVECQQTGRPEAGSDVWYKLYLVDGNTQFVPEGRVVLLPPDATVPPC